MSDIKTEQGQIYKIQVMANKYCSGVSKRSLSTPLGYEVENNPEARTFKVTVKAYCNFGTRINIDNPFYRMKLAGQGVEDATVNGWVNAELPGREIARIELAGEYNAEGKPSDEFVAKYSKVDFEGVMSYSSDIGCHTFKELKLSNSIEIDMDDIPLVDPVYTAPSVPEITKVLATHNSLIVYVSVDSFGEGGGGEIYLEYKSRFAQKYEKSYSITEKSGEIVLDGLIMSNHYTVRAYAKNNGLQTEDKSKKNLFQTVSVGRILSVSPRGDGKNVNVSYQILAEGGGNSNPSASLERSFDNGKHWSADQGGSTRPGIHDEYFNYEAYAIDGIIHRTKPGDAVLIRVCTWTYDDLEPNTESYCYSEEVEFIIPNTTYGSITEINPSTNSAEVFFTVDTKSVATVYYRPYGMEEEWVSAGSVDIEANATESITINNLIPNYAEYEVSINFKSEDDEYNTGGSRFFTVPAQVYNRTCETLNYHVQLICQVYKSIKSGNIPLFMNDDSKKWCEDEENIATIASIMSRINRYFEVLECLLCTLGEFNEVMNSSSTGKVLMGDVGWSTVDTAPSKGSIRLLTSGGAHTAVQNLIKQVWHSGGSYDYYGTDYADLATQKPTKVGATGVIPSYNFISTIRVYKWSGSSWSTSQNVRLENFAVIHINSGKYEGQAFYLFERTLNRLDADTTEVEKRLDALEAINPVLSTRVESALVVSDNYSLAILPYGLTDDEYKALTPVSENETIMLLTSDIADEDHVEIVVAESSGNYQQGGE